MLIFSTCTYVCVYVLLVVISLLAEALFLVFADGRKLPWVENGYIEHAP